MNKLNKYWVVDTDKVVVKQIEGVAYVETLYETYVLGETAFSTRAEAHRALARRLKARADEDERIAKESRALAEKVGRER